MQHAMLIPEKANFFSLNPDEIDHRLGEWGWEKYRGRQLREWIYHKLSADPGEISNLSKLQRQTLTEGFDFGLGRVTHRQMSDGWHVENTGELGFGCNG